MTPGKSLRSACLTLLLSSVAFAEGGNDAADSGARKDIQRDTQRLGRSAGVRPEVLTGNGGYGSAGCGLGSVIFRPSEHFVQVFVATTNNLFGNQTFGITSGTSNCAGGPKAAQALNQYIVANRSALASDIARGRGETIVGLSALAACEQPSELGSVLQRNFRSIFPRPGTSDEQVSGGILAVLHRHQSELGCRRLV